MASSWQNSSPTAYSEGSFPYYTTTGYSSTVNGNTVYGEWIEINIPVADIVYSYTFGTSDKNLLPTSWIIVGSNSHNGPWTSIPNTTNNTSITNVYTIPSSVITSYATGIIPPFTINVNTTTLYSCYRIIFTSAYSNTLGIGVNFFYMNMLSYGLGGSISSSSFSPTQITGLNNWYDGSDPNGDGTIPANGASISSWKDKTTNANHMIARQNSAIYTSNGLNGLGIMSFANTWYRTTTDNAPYPFDAYVVVKLNSTTTAVDVLSSGNRFADNFNSLTFSEYSTSRWHNGSNGFSRTPNAVSPTNETSTSFLLMSWTIANNNFYIYRNGVQNMSSTSYAWNPNGNIEFRIGTRHHYNANNQLNGSIAEVLFYNSQLSTTNRQKVEGYLAWKWGIQTSLPNTHPYYSIGPN